MSRYFRVLTSLSIFMLMIATMTGCAPAQTTPAQTSSTTGKTDSTPFILNVIPEQLNGHSIAGQQCMFLVTISDEGQKSTATAEITASASGAKITVNKKAILDGQVAEVVVVPEKSRIGKPIEVKVTGKRGSVSQQKSITFEVIEGEDDRQEYAVKLRAMFIEWLAAKHPDLGITSATKWTGTMVSPQWLVVSHYLFFSDEWEMHVEWHIMIAPHDWVRIDLRKRYTELKPSAAFEISSIAAKSEPIAIEIPASVWR